MTSETSRLEPTGPWSRAEALSFLERAKIPARIAAIAPSGWPLIVSLWFVCDGNALWCATTRSAKIVPIISANHRCGFEVASEQPPYRGVRGQARATIHAERGAEVLATLIDRYLGTRNTQLARWLLSRSKHEVALRLEPIRWQSWDYTARMTNRPG